MLTLPWNCQSTKSDRELQDGAYGESGDNPSSFDENRIDCDGGPGNSCPFFAIFPRPELVPLYVVFADWTEGLSSSACRIDDSEFNLIRTVPDASNSQSPNLPTESSGENSTCGMARADIKEMCGWARRERLTRYYLATIIHGRASLWTKEIGIVRKICTMIFGDDLNCCAPDFIFPFSGVTTF